MLVADDHEQDTPEERSYLPVCAIKILMFGFQRKYRFFPLTSLRKCMRGIEFAVFFALFAFLCAAYSSNFHSIPIVYAIYSVLI